MAGAKKTTKQERIDQKKLRLLDYGTKLGHSIKLDIERQVRSDSEKMIKARSPEEAMYYHGRISSLFDLLDSSTGRYGFMNLIYCSVDVRIVPTTKGG